MYESYFQLTAPPFSLTPNPNFFCKLKSHQDALDVLLFSIQGGDGFIKIVGEVGTGKTLLCRKLLESLDDQYVTAYIPNPELTPIELKKAFARELGLNPTESHDQHELITSIFNHLISQHAKNKKTILLIDEAQVLTDESLETVRLLTNLETENTKLLQVVLFGQPELDVRLNQHHLRQLNQRIIFSYTLPLMNRKDLEVYIHHRLAVAGYTHGNLFTDKACHLIYKASRGIPRIVNILSHKALLVAYGRGAKEINHKDVRMAVNDTQAAKKENTGLMTTIAIYLLYVLVFILLLYYFQGYATS